jgi:hypothetical protein
MHKASSAASVADALTVVIADGHPFFRSARDMLKQDGCCR